MIDTTSHSKTFLDEALISRKAKVQQS